MYEQEIDVLSKMYSKFCSNGWRRGDTRTWNRRSPRCLLQTFDQVITEASPERQTIVYKAIINIEDIMRYFIAVDDENNLFTQICYDTECTSIIEWNDYKYRSIDDVFELIDRTLSYYLTEQTKPEVIPIT